MTGANTDIELSVVVCTYNRVDWLRGALESLIDQTLDQSRFEVLLIDNNSTDETAAVAREFKGSFRNFSYLMERQQGLSHARNLGWQSAQGEFVAFIDDDARADREWCKGIVRAFRSTQPSPVSVGGKVIPIFDAPLPSWFTEDIEIRSWGEDAHFLDAQRARYGFSGSNMAFPREVLQRYGGFSTGLGMQGRKIRLGEDSLLFSKIQAKEPLLWYEPGLIVHHLVPQRNLEIRYRLSRAYAAGRSLAFMQREWQELNSWRVELQNTAYFIKEFLSSIWRDRTDTASRFRKVSDLVKQVGVLAGRLFPEQGESELINGDKMTTGQDSERSLQKIVDAFRARFGRALKRWRLRHSRNFGILFDIAANDFGILQKRYEIESLCSHIARISPSTVCEVGSHRAGTSFLLSQTARSAEKILFVDREILNEDLLAYYTGGQNNLYFVEGDSTSGEVLGRVRGLLSEQPLDFLFIDGDHSYPGVRRDFLAYYDLVRDGGWIAFHDITPDYMTLYNRPTGIWSGEVYKLWRAIKPMFEAVEFIEKEGQDGFGIGIIKKNSEIGRKQLLACLPEKL